MTAASTLLGAAGVLTGAAAVQRWWPVCRPGAFDTGACLQTQDDSYDLGARSDSWSLIGSVADLQSLALLALAAAVLLLPRVLGGRRPDCALSVAGWVVAAGIVAVAALTWFSSRSGEPVTVPGAWVPGVLWLLGLPALLVAVVATADLAPRRVWAARWGVVVCVGAFNPFIELILASVVFGYSSHDTPPWGGAITGVLLIVAAVLVWPAHRSETSGVLTGVLTEQTPPRLTRPAGGPGSGAGLP